MNNLKNRRIKKNDINGWNEEEEVILKGWADQATCYNWLHSKSHEKYFKVNAGFTIPVIVISTITGAANFAIDRLEDTTKSYAMMIIGVFNILAGIISTVAQFLRIAEINEGHRVATIAWDKYSRNVKIELAKNPVDRRPASEMLKIYKEEFDRLVETSPKLQDEIINQFNKVFEGNTIVKPEITGIIKETIVFDRTKIEWEMDVIERAPIQINIKEEVEKFKRSYFEANGKFPNENEIKDHFPNQNINVDDDGNIVSRMITIVMDPVENEKNKNDNPDDIV